MVQTKLIKTIDEDRDIPSVKNPNETRLLFINTNGLDLGTDAHYLNELYSNSKSQQYNILLLAETNTHWKNKRSKDKFRNTIAKQWTRASVTTAETNIPWYLIYKLGGTAIITDILTRSRKTKSGEYNHGLGRRSFIATQRQDGRNITLVFVYKMCSATIEPTRTNTIMTQQWIMLHEKLEKESIASLTITNLEIFITKLTKLNYNVIICIDGNEAFTSNVYNIARVCTKGQLIDSISTQYGTKGEPNTYARGPDRID